MKSVMIVVTLFLLPLSVWAGTFLDTFEDGNLDGWREVVPWDREPGSWEIVDGGLHGSIHDGYPRLFTTGDDTWKDYTVEFDVRPLKKHGRPTIAIAARVQEKWWVRCSIIDAVVVLPGGGNAPQRGWVLCSAGNMNGGKSKGLFFEPHPLIKLNRWAHFKLSAEGNIFTFWINGEQVMEPTELRIFRNREGFEDFPDFQTGGIGIGLSNYTARFDNVTVTGDSIPDSGAFAVTPQGKLATTWGHLKRF
ncbi:hypothetical protein C6503_01335 [Candidatus Poribacteria bacterium]|nr:MAG: hypothetical protein C6503_01335 [Candidatus Poribacteria bacterium]